jgi:hypothetical protein
VVQELYVVRSLNSATIHGHHSRSFKELCSHLHMQECSIEHAGSMMADELWRYHRDFISAVAIRNGLECRLYSAVRMSFPVMRAQVAVAHFFALCTFLKYSIGIMRRLLKKHKGLFPDVYSDTMVSRLHRRLFARRSPRSSTHD